MRLFTCAIIWCLFFLLIPTLTTNAMVELGIQDVLVQIEEGKPFPRHIQHANNRVAVFTYEDPENTGLGNEIALMIAREILFNSNLYSLGVLMFRTDLSSQKDDNLTLTYFDKVEKIIEKEGVDIAIWGRILPTRSGLIVDSFVQIPPKSLSENFYWKFKLPQTIGGVLHAHLRPSRIHLQSLNLGKSAEPDIASAAHNLRILREYPPDDSQKLESIPIVGEIPIGKTYRVLNKENGWAHVEIINGSEGWVPVSVHSTSSCKPLLDAAGFVGDILAKRVRNITNNLTVEALAISEQLRALDALKQFFTNISYENPEFDEIFYQLAFDYSARWIGEERWTGICGETNINRGQGIPPGGAAFSNISSIAKIAKELHKTYKKVPKNFNDIRPEREEIREIVNELARASLDDPNNLDVLKNLVMLFNFLDDSKRSKIAESLVMEISQSN